MIKVSILVPIYGVEPYIERCAKSLFEQTYPNIEYVFVNDCTKDKSIDKLYKVIGSYSHRKPQVKIINHDSNKGLGSARRTALLNATGDYILHVDSDDYIAQNAVEVLVNKANTSKSDIIDSAFAEIKGDTQIKVNLPFHGSTELYIDLVLSRTGLLTNQIWGRLIKRSLYDCNVINKEGIDLGEDYSVLPILLYKGQRIYVDEVLYYYRIDNGASYMNSCLSTKNIESCISAHSVVYDYFSNKHLSKSIRYSLELGMLNLVVFCRKNKYDFQNSNLYKRFNIDYWSLKIYQFSLNSSLCKGLSLLIKSILRRRYKRLMDKV